MPVLALFKMRGKRQAQLLPLWTWCHDDVVILQWARTQGETMSFKLKNGTFVALCDTTCGPSKRTETPFWMRFKRSCSPEQVGRGRLRIVSDQGARQGSTTRRTSRGGFQEAIWPILTTLFTRLGTPRIRSIESRYTCCTVSRQHPRQYSLRKSRAWLGF